MRKTVLTYGLAAGALMSALMLVTMRFHDRIGFGTTGLLVGYASMALAFLLVFAGVKAYRDQVAGGAVTFGRAFQVGLLITVLASACYVATWQVVYYKFMPDFLDQYAAYSLAEAKKAGATAAQLAATTQEMAAFKELYKNPLVNIGFAFLEPLPVGLLFTLTAAGVLRRKGRAEAA
ncbi:MAG: DUF4199 domain-containing protein [Holophagaceae bacterium]|nr:DUF4199 domain-containing protein [Holophagaceae bacterium]